MNKRSYFLACVNVHVTRSDVATLPPGGARLLQSYAWLIPEDAIPEDPAEAAMQFVTWGTWWLAWQGYSLDALRAPKDGKLEWVARWEESLVTGGSKT